MILLISDLHLQEERPDITRAFYHFLEKKAVQARTLYILGDFFEVWIGDDAIAPFHLEVAAALKHLSDKGVQVLLMHGNRDFLIGKRFCQLAGCRLLKDPSLITANDEQILLMHGDSLCASDVDYQRMKRILRNPLGLFILRCLPLKIRRHLAGNLRQQSQNRTRMKSSHMTDVSPQTVAQVMRKYQVHTLIHGHTHRPASHKLPHGRRIVLGDWDQKGWYVCINATGIRLESFTLT